MTNIDPARAARINAVVARMPKGKPTAKAILKAARAAEMTVEECMYVFCCSASAAKFFTGNY